MGVDSRFCATRRQATCRKQKRIWYLASSAWAHRCMLEQDLFTQLPGFFFFAYHVHTAHVLVLVLVHAPPLDVTSHDKIGRQTSPTPAVFSHFSHLFQTYCLYCQCPITNHQTQSCLNSENGHYAYLLCLSPNPIIHDLKQRTEILVYPVRYSQPTP